MAVLHHFLNSSSWLSSQHPSPDHQADKDKHHIVWRSHRPPPRKLTITASSTKNSRVKSGKSVKSNVELYTELQEFVSMAGLPQGHVPSFKELSHHGRKDLANIVRRRGYKFIAELLGNSTPGDNDKETSLDATYKGTVDYAQEVSGLLAESLLQSSDASNTDTLFSTETGVPPPVAASESSGDIESETSSTLLEKASKFIKDGELDNVEDVDDINVDHGSSCMIGMDEAIELGSSGIQISNNKVCEDNDTSEIKTSTSSFSPVFPLESHSEAFLSVDGDHALSQKNLEVQSGESENEDEFDRLKAMLHQKEMELHQLKEQIEKEKRALSALQEKAENEIGKAQKLVLSKDGDLHDAMETLSGLKEVQIEYSGHGETVEVTGSFNGWHDRIKMDSQPLPMSLRSTEPRNSRLWSTVLWLYPGIYEIKFVVDGHWMIDPQRESVSKGAIHNNILRVGR